MSAQWHQSSSHSFERASSAIARAWGVVGQPKQLALIRRGILFVLVFWAIFALVKLLWLLVPEPNATIPSGAAILNPVESEASNDAVRSVDINKMRSWHLFGIAGSEDAATPEVEEIAARSDRDGIEDGAHDTRLDLKLRGVVSVSEDGLGHAMIEHRSKQEVYAVGDKLPVGKNVTLAKVLPHGVVLDNRGTYELLKLFDETPLLGQVSREAPAPRPKKIARAAAQEIPRDGNSSAVAQGIRRQLYNDPQSLADVVRVSAVRENNALRGYRIDPGKSSAQFSQLGFHAGDIVTSVNGISLDNPANTMQLYQLMRSASEAVFDVERGAETLTLTVNLNGDADDG
ncbi:MAG: type II secretion system protein GspC [Halioglobus sp.]